MKLCYYLLISILLLSGCTTAQVLKFLSPPRYFKGGDKREAYVKDHPELSEYLKSVIRVGNFTLGMTTEEVTAALGQPRRKNKSCYSWGCTEQWIYNMYPNTIYLYFKNDILTSWQD